MRPAVALISVLLGFPAISRANPEVGAPATVPAQLGDLYAQMLQLKFSNSKLALQRGNEALNLLEGLAADDGNQRFAAYLICDLARLQWRERDSGKTLVLINKGLKNAEKHMIDPVRRELLLLGARIDLANRDIATAEMIGGEVLEEAQAASDHEAEIESLNLLGDCESAKGHFPQALQNLHQALESLHGNDNPEQRVKLLFSLAALYLQAADWERALGTDREALAQALQIGDRETVAHLLFLASDVEGHLHHSDLELSDLQEAEEIGKSLQNAVVLNTAEIDLSDSLLNRQDYARALLHANRGLTLSRQLVDRVGEATALINQGTALNHLGQHGKGLAAFEEGLKYFQDTNSKADVAEITGGLAQEYAFAGDYRKAFEAEKKFKELNDRLYHDSNAQNLQALEFHYQSEKQEREIALLITQNERRVLTHKFEIVASVLSLALMAALLARFRLLRQNARKLKLLNDQLEVLSFTDPLTGLRNRRFFFQNVDRYTEDADRAHAGVVRKPQQDHEFLIFYIIDLDHFKQINDTYGHHTGDQVLVQSVERLRTVIRGCDELIRWGGEEFLFTARHSSLDDGPRVAERLRSAIEAEPFDLGTGRFIKRTCSIGFAFYPLVVHVPGRPNWEAVVALADQALYAAKAAGRNGWVGASASEDVTVEALEIGLVGGLQDLAQKGLCVLQSSFLGEAKVVYQ